MSGFRAFMLEANALALAIGVIIGTALGTVVTSLVNDIILPPIGLALGGVDFTQLKIVLRAATGGDPATEVAIRWGLFLNAVIAFIIVAFVVWQISRMFIKEEAAKQVEVLRAEHGDRRIVSWSQHDLEVVRTLRDGDPELIARFESRYANALSVAKHWRNRVHGGAKPPSGRLADYLVMIGYPVPQEAAPGQVGETIRVLRRRLEQELPPTTAQQARWKRLVEHNRHDCAGMRRVCIRATMELGATAH